MGVLHKPGVEAERISPDFTATTWFSFGMIDSTAITVLFRVIKEDPDKTYSQTNLVSVTLMKNSDRGVGVRSNLLFRFDFRPLFPGTRYVATGRKVNL